MKPIEDYFVPWLRGQKMYVSSHIDLAWRRPELHRLMSNENPNPPSQKVIDAILQYAKIANRYPDQGFAVREKIARINGLPGIENVLLGNGSSEVYDMLWRSFVAPGEEIIQHTPCFGIYKLRGSVLGAKMVSVPMIHRDNKLLYDADGILAAITPKTKAIVIANPNNPTGNFMDDADFLRIAEAGAPFVVDEAYVEYAGLRKSQVKLVKDYKNVFITRTLSKAYGLAGMRFGYALGDKDVIMQIAATLIPWNVSTIAMWAALAALEDTAALNERVEFNNEEVEYIEREVGKIKGITVFHSYGNYILFDSAVPGKNGKGMVDFAEKKGLILRGQEPMYGSDGWFRVTIGSHDENELFVRAVREYFTA
ncbi:MAG TPA: histidinol-phosphate transaminase [Anaerolineales bacterium]|nr:histidinol-phosphate transaminase [Anaerolineales bacterium]